MATEHAPPPEKTSSEMPSTPIATAAPTASVSDASRTIEGTLDSGGTLSVDAGRASDAVQFEGLRRRERNQRWKDVLIRTLFVAFLVGLWQVAHFILVTRLDWWSPALFRSPMEVVRWMLDGFALSYFTGGYIPPPGEPMPQTFWEALKQAPYPPAIWASIWRLLQGYGIAVTVGFPLGLLVARFALAEKTIGWLSISLQSLPSICWVPLALLWFGRLNEAPILFVTVFGALFATIVAVADGIRNVPPLLARAGRTLGADGPRLYFSVLLPAALPNIVTGLKIGWSFAWRSLMAAELIVNSGGLGFLLERDRDNGDMEGVIATIIIIIVIGLAVQELVFAPLQKRLSTLWGLTGVRA
jgi:NitT/TauT family transport system permease protein